MNAGAEIALLGNPNSGKTTLFNGLTGLSARVGNYPGITVEHREGRAALDDGTELRVIDLPGTYSLVPRADDEAVAVRALLGTLPGQKAPPQLVVAVADATHLERNLYLVSQLRAFGVPLVVALTMTDTLEEDGGSLDIDALAARIGVPVVRASGVRPDEVAGLKRTIAEALQKPVAEPLATEVAAHDDKTREIGERLRTSLPIAADAEILGGWARSAAAAGTFEKLGLRPEVASLVDGESSSRHDGSVEHDVRAHFSRVEQWLDGVVSTNAARPRSEALTDRLDRWALHPVAGPVIMLGIFGLLFQALFSWSEPFMDLIEAGVGAIGDVVAGFLPESMPLLRSLWNDGFVAGVGNVLVFVPQIAALFLFLGFLEDSGYLARAAFILDRLMSKVGLHGRAFVPMLSGFACAVPALMATRTIENEKDRFVTILVTPLVSCSARLPVYTLMIATAFASAPPVFGVLHPGTVLMFSMYGLSVVAAVGMAALFKRTLLKSPTPPLVLELPPYRLPRPLALTKHVLGRVRVFLVDAGTVILAITVVLWGMFTFPRNENIAQELETRTAEVEGLELPDEEKADRLSHLEAEAASAQLEQSIGGRLGHALEPVMAPLGFDWKISVGIIASFAAREVLVSTLGLVYGLGDGTDEESVSLRDALRADRNRAGEKVHTPLTALSLMVFFVLAMQCMSTLATTRRETRSWRWPVIQFGYMTVLAYVGALLVQQGGRLLGFS